MFVRLALALLLLAGCGYRPVRHLAAPALSERVSTEIVISMQDPDNTVLLKDALDEAVVNRFGTALVERRYAQTHLRMTLQKVRFKPVRYDANGYIIAYLAIVPLEIERTRDGVTRRYSSRGMYQFAIEPNAIISEQARFDAIRYGAVKALDGFIARIASERP